MPPKHNCTFKDHNNAIQLDFAKCIGCNSCVRACDAQGLSVYEANAEKSNPPTIKMQRLIQSPCIGCGQCVVACPVSAIIARSEIENVQLNLQKPNILKIALIAPSTRIAIGESFGMQPGEIAEAQLIGSLKQLGFDRVFDVNFGADETTVVDTQELLHNLGKQPVFTSCCPGWINLAEQQYPALIPFISTAKSCVAMVATLVRKEYPDAFVIDVMPCTAKKDEAKRSQLKGDVDVCLTVVEIATLIKEAKIDFANQNGQFDPPYHKCSGGAYIFGKTGGVAENVIRQVGLIWNSSFEIVGKETLFATKSNDQTVIKHIVQYSNGKQIIAVVACGGSALQFVCNGVQTNTLQADLFEHMACPLGCQGGGGMPRGRKIAERARGMEKLDEASNQKVAGQNDTLWSHGKSAHEVESNLHTTFSEIVK